jgi:hypothetical protein
VIEYQINATNIDCNGNNTGMVEVVSNEVDIIWNNNDTNFSIDSLTIGTYIFELTDEFGCQKTDSTIITEPSALQLNSNVIDPFDGQNGAIELLVEGGTEPYFFEWNTINETNSIENAQQGFYSCTVIDSNGCEVYFETTLIDLSNSEVYSSDFIRWNSVTQMIEVPFYSHGKLCVFDSKGALVLEQVVHSGKMLDLSSLSNGIYSVSFLNTDVNSFATLSVFIHK